MELPEVKFDELLVSRFYLIVCYRADKPCSYQIYNGTMIGTNRDYFVDGEDLDGDLLTYKFFQLPEKVK